MADPQHKHSWIDPSKRAGFALDTIIESTSEEALARQELQTSIEDELRKAPVANVVSDRSQSRLLFVTRDLSVLQEGSVARLNMLNLSDTFSEIHILVLCESWQAKKGSERIAKNTWVYTTSTRFFIQQPFAALSVAHSQLQFADGFRPDIVIALDPFESGLCGLLIAEKYDRAFQVHVTEDMFAPDFLAKDDRNKLRMRIMKYVLKRTQSVRTVTLNLKTKLQKSFPHITDISLLPRHYDIKTLMEIGASENATDPFPQYVFKVLFVGKLDHESTLFRALDASRSILVSKSIGFLVLGDGPNLKEFQERANILGIAQQVVFQKDQSKLIEYLAVADVLLCTDTTEGSDEIVIKAAAAGLPIVAARTPLREDLFVDGESAFLCDPEDTLDFSQKLVKFLNTNTLRTQFEENAKDIVKVRLEEDPAVYKLAYRTAIESVYEGIETPPVPEETVRQEAEEVARQVQEPTLTPPTATTSA